MATATTQSVITNGQIGQINDRLATKLRESGLPAEEVQAILAAPGGKVVDEMVAVVRKHVEAVSEMIVREVEVDYDIPPEKAIHATKRVEYLDNEVVAAMPRNGKGKKRVKVCFFPLRRYRGVGEVDKMLSERGLRPDPYAVSKVNETDPSFSDDHPNGTQWVDAEGRLCCAIFGRWRGRRRLRVGRSGLGWDGAWWVGGVPASS